MADNAAAKECVLSRLLGAIEELVDQHNVARFVFFLQRTNRAHADDPLHAEFFHGPNIGAVIQFGWQKAVTSSMPGQKNDIAFGKLTGEKLVGWRAKRGF